MLELDALGRRRRAGRVEDAGHVVGSDGALRGVELGVVDGRAQVPERAQLASEGDDAAERGEVLRPWTAELGQHGEIVLAAEALERDQRRRVAVVEDVRELARPRPRADRYQGGAEHRHREVDEQPLRTVAHQEGNLVAALHAEPPQPLRELAGAAARLAVAQALGAGHDELAGRVAGGDLVEQVGQGAAPRLGHISS